MTHTTEGKVFVYEATARRTSVAAKAVRQIIDRFWSGSAEQFLAGMVDEKVLSADGHQAAREEGGEVMILVDASLRITVVAAIVA